MKNKIQLFEEKKISTVWVEETKEWYFSVIDVVGVLTDTDRSISSRSVYRYIETFLEAGFVIQ